MRTLIGIAVVIGIFLTASVAAAKVYKCTPTKIVICSEEQCTLEPKGRRYTRLDSKTGEYTDCDRDKSPMCEETNQAEVTTFGYIIKWVSEYGSVSEMSTVDGKWREHSNVSFIQAVKKNIEH
jgi:hypothetical protein